jgi:hypothetical protein
MALFYLHEGVRMLIFKWVKAFSSRDYSGMPQAHISEWVDKITNDKGILALMTVRCQAARRSDYEGL